MEQQAPLRAGTRLGQHLRGQYHEREPSIDDLTGQAGGGEPSALDNRVEADLLGVADAIGKFGEGVAVVPIGSVNDVSSVAELVCEGEAPARQSQGMMKQQ